MLIFIYIVTIIYAFSSGLLVPSINKNIKMHNFFWIWCTLILLLLSVTTNTLNYSDVSPYQYQFNLANVSHVPLNELNDISFGFYVLFKVSYALGLNYRGMMLISIIICMFLLHRFLENEIVNENIFWGLFLIFPGIVEIIQIKYFLGSTIVVYSFKYLLSDKKYNSIKFVIGVFIAYLFHSSCIIFLLLLGVKIIKKYKVNIPLKITIIGIFVFSLFLRFVPLIATKVISSIRMERYFGSLATGTSIDNFFQVTIYWLSVVFITRYCYLKLEKQMIANKSISKIEFIFKNYAALCILGITLPLLIYDLNFFRFIEIGYIFGYVTISAYFNRENSYKKVILLISLIFIAYLAYHFYSGGNGVALFKFDGWVNVLRVNGMQ